MNPMMRSMLYQSWEWTILNRPIVGSTMRTLVRPAAMSSTVKSAAGTTSEPPVNPPIGRTDVDAGHLRRGSRGTVEMLGVVVNAEIPHGCTVTDVRIAEPGAWPSTPDSLPTPAGPPRLRGPSHPATSSGTAQTERRTACRALRRCMHLLPIAPSFVKEESTMHSHSRMTLIVGTLAAVMATGLAGTAEAQGRESAKADSSKKQKHSKVDRRDDRRDERRDTRSDQRRDRRDDVRDARRPLPQRPGVDARQDARRDMRDDGRDDRRDRRHDTVRLRRLSEKETRTFLDSPVRNRRLERTSSLWQRGINDVVLADRESTREWRREAKKRREALEVRFAARMATFDADGNGVLNRDEQRIAAVAFESHRSRIQQALDADGNGTVSFEEMKASNPTYAPYLEASRRRFHEKVSNHTDLMNSFDVDRNGQLNSTERRQAWASWAEQQVEMLAAFDTDGDGVFNDDEIEALVQVLPDQATTIHAAQAK